MTTIRDFIENNENIPIIIETSETKDTTDPLRKELWKGMLYDIPKDLQNREVIQEGYGIVAQCNILTILEEGDEKWVDIRMEIQNMQADSYVWNVWMKICWLEESRDKNKREQKHIKDLYCLKCGEVTKCIEVRFCDSYEEIFEAAKIKRENYYINDYESEVDNNVL